MDKPAALRKAEALEQHMAGLSKDSAQVTLTDVEAWELLDWLEDQIAPEFQADYAVDLAKARLLENPWEMLDETFEVLGFGIVPLKELH